MAWLPPVNIPQISGTGDYAQQLYGMLSGVGDAFYQNRRDEVGDTQWDQDYARRLAADEFARSESDRNYALDLQKLEQGEAAGDEKWYGSPQWYTGSDDQPRFGVLSDQGNFRDMPPPEGGKWAPSVTFQDTGTAKVPMFTKGGGLAGPALPIDVAGAEAQKVFGDAGGKTAAALPVVEASADRLIRMIDDVMQDPVLATVTGPAGGRVPTWLSTDPGAADTAQSKIDLILGGTFLQAYNDLRGAGAITEREGQAATAAYTRLRTQSMSDEEYLNALVEFRAEVVKLTEIARQRAAASGVGGAAPQGEPYVSPGGAKIIPMGQ